MNTRLEQALKGLRFSGNSRLLELTEASSMKLAFGKLVPEWYYDMLHGFPIIHALFDIMAFPGTRKLEFSIQWMSPADMLDECTNAYPGRVAIRHGFVPFGSDLTGGGNPFFINMLTNDDPPVVQIFHDSVSEHRDLDDEHSMWTISTSLSTFIEAATIRG